MTFYIYYYRYLNTHIIYVDTHTHTHTHTHNYTRKQTKYCKYNDETTLLELFRNDNNNRNVLTMFVCE